MRQWNRYEWHRIVTELLLIVHQITKTIKKQEEKEMIEAKRINEKGVHVRIEETGADILMEFTQIVRSVCK